MRDVEGEVCEIITSCTKIYTSAYNVTEIVTRKVLDNMDMQL
jgi:hypothetical protein